MKGERPLLVDFGNSRLKWALAGSGSLLETGAFDWRSGSLERLLDRHWGTLETPGVVVACVVAPQAAGTLLSQWVKQHWRTEVHFMAADRELLGLSCGYHDPGQLGADRWAALLAAHHRYPQGSLVVDCGTANTIDALAGGRHLGGFILPGMEAMRAAVLQGTAIGETGAARHQTGWWGRSTASCVELGGVRALVALVEDSLERLQAEGVCDPTLVVTGGQAGFILPSMQVDYRRHDDLVLEGVMLYSKELFE